MEAQGFVYSEILTKEMRDKAREDRARKDLVQDMVTKGRDSYSVGQHLWTTLQVRYSSRCIVSPCLEIFI